MVGCTLVVKCTLLAIACDLHAEKKVCSFLSHSANLGCSCCYCKFSLGFSKCDYLNLNRDSWHNKKHRADAEVIKNCNNKTAREKELELGCRYSSLLCLIQFNFYY